MQQKALTVQVVIARIATLILWLGTVALGIADIYFIRSIFASIFVRFSDEVKTGGMIATFLLLILGLGLIVYVITTGEYHMKHAGTNHSWRLIAVSYIVLGFFPILAYFMG